MTFIEGAYMAATGASEDEIVERPDEPGNAAIHIAALAMTKTADALIDPKLVLAWALSALGAPAAAIGALVPVREAGALAPQLLIAPRVQGAKRVKYIWAIGSAGQAVAALGIAAALATLSADVVGWVVIGLLALFAVARAACSASYKDALARTVGKGRRGAVSGAASSAAAVAALVFAGLLAVGVIPLTVSALAAAIAIGGVLWLTASAFFLRLKEPASETQTGDALKFNIVETLRGLPQLRQFILARSLLTATALGAPFLLLASHQNAEAALGDLGPYLLASAAASILSAYVWGRLSDRSSRQTLMAAASLAGVVYATAAAVGAATGGLGGWLGASGLLFAAQLAYQGVRSGRKIHLTDMAGDGDRALYVAISNTLIGGVLILGGAFGVIADALGPNAVLAIFSALSIAGAVIAAGLDEVQQKQT